MEVFYDVPQVKAFAAYLVDISEKNPPKHTYNMWYLSPEQHAVELILFNIIYGLGLLVTLYGRKRPKIVEDDSPQELSFILKVYRAILTVCFLVTFVHKINGQKIQMILMPCHMTTLCYLYTLWTKSKEKAEIMFNISVHFMFFTWLAMLFPDHTGLHQQGEILNFWVHHWILLIIPFHLIIVKQYRLDTSGAYYYRLAAFLGGLFHYDVYVFLDIISGQNVGYMLCPPPKSPFQGKYFRFYHAGLLIVMGILCGFVIPQLINRLVAMVQRFSGSKESKAKQS